MVDKPLGKGVVTEANYLRETVKVSLEGNSETTEVELFPASDVKNIGKRRKNGTVQLDVSPEEEAELKKLSSKD